MNREILKYFLSILKQRDYTKGQLQYKGLLRQYKKAEINEAIDYLESKNFVNDKRLAKNLIAKYNGQKGPVWIKQKLKQKYISAEIIDSLEGEVETKPNQKIMLKILKKYKIEKLSEADYKIKQKVNHYLFSLGFKSI